MEARYSVSLLPTVLPAPSARRHPNRRPHRHPRAQSAFNGKWKVSPAREARADGGEKLPEPSARECGAGAGAASEEPSACIVEYTMSVRPSVDIPEAIGRHVSGIFKSQVSKIFDDLEVELARRSAAGRA
eukprot:365247-Chlamydomonas_euryale.AAC.18